MCPAIENRENPIFDLGKNGREHTVYAFIVDLQAPDILDLNIFDQCLEEAIKTVRLAFPTAIKGYEEMVRNKFKWIGYPDKLVVFSEAFDHIDVRDQVLTKGLVVTEAQGGGRLDVLPEGRHIHGGSGTLLDDKAFTRAESKKYKLEYLPTKLGREHFTYE